MRINKLWSGLLALAAAALIAACGGSGSGNANGSDGTPAVQDAKVTPAAATVMVYLLGTDLESNASAGTANLKQMLAAKYSSDVNVVVTTGGANKAKTDDPVTDWRTVRRYSLRAGKLIQLADLGKHNMVDPGTLEDFIVWAKTTFPAQKYHLVFWDHGGAYKGFGPDEMFGPQTMSVPQIQSALKQAKTRSGIRFETIGFDACLMAHAEVAYALMPYANYLAASKELEPGSGWDYTAVLSALAQQPSITSRELGRVIADSYVALQKKEAEANQARGAVSNDVGFLTFSVIDLSRIGELRDALKSFAVALSGFVRQSTDDWVKVAVQRALNAAYGGDTAMPSGAFDVTDLGSLADRFATEGIVTEQSRELSAAVRQAVTYRANGTQASYSSVISIYSSASTFRRATFRRRPMTATTRRSIFPPNTSRSCVTS